MVVPLCRIKNIVSLQRKSILGNKKSKISLKTWLQLSANAAQVRQKEAHDR